MGWARTAARKVRGRLGEAVLVLQRSGTCGVIGRVEEDVSEGSFTACKSYMKREESEPDGSEEGPEETGEAELDRRRDWKRRLSLFRRMF
jgi:hypothetical protein